MTALLLDPHGDDAALFAAYTAIRENAHVHIPYPTVPTSEIEEAYSHALKVPWSIGPSFPLFKRSEVAAVYVPARRLDGHEQHNAVAEKAWKKWPDLIVEYETYAPRGQRTRTDNEVPYEPWMVARKLRALSCFVSQIEQESTRPWFTSLLDLREWYA